jgi:hypothetical protein
MKIMTALLTSLSIGFLCVGCAITQEPTENDHCTGNSCNTYILPEDNCPEGQDPFVLWHDSDNDTLPEPGNTITVCVGGTIDVPAGWTDVVPPPYDPCPGDPQNVCGTTTPSIQITAVVNGHTVAIKGDPHYANGTVSRVVFYNGVLEIGTDTSVADGWSINWLNVPTGSYTVHAVMYTTDGKTATSNSVSVTIGIGQCVPTMRCSWAYDTPSTVKYFNGISTSCYASWAGQDPNWQWSTFRSCHDASDGCVLEDEVFSGAINAGRCEFNNVVPQFLNGNPENPFGEDLGYLINWALSPDGNGGAYNALATGYPTCYINPDCTDYVQVPVVPICHLWGCNFMVDLTGAVNPISGNTVNIFVNTYIDSDGDGFPNACQAGDSTCVADNCIRYANPIQALNACTGHPNPFEDDSDNDWYLDGEDAFPFDRTRH